MPNWPGKNPKPKASSGPPTVPSLFRSKPDGIPVLDGATNRYGYSIAAAPLCGTDR